MGILFKDELHDAFGTWPLGYIPFGGADFGEVLAVARTVGEGDNDAYYRAWTAAGDRLAEQAPKLERPADDKPHARPSCAPLVTMVRLTTRFSAAPSIRA